MGILLFVVFGLIVGLLARALMPGRQSMGWLWTALLGIAGSLLGGFIASALSNNEPARFHAVGLIGSVLGALLLLAIARAVSGRHHPLRT